MPIKLIGAVIVCILLAGCAMNRGLVGGTSTFCQIAKPITWSVNDTDQTIAEAKSHNAVGKKLCKW